MIQLGHVVVQDALAQLGRQMGRLLRDHVLAPGPGLPDIRLSSTIGVASLMEDRTGGSPDDLLRPAGLIKLSGTTIPWDGILIDQGLDDRFLAEQLHPHLLQAACQAIGQPPQRFPAVIGR